MFKTIIKKFKEWYRRRFYNVAIDYSNGTDYTAETHYSIDKQGNIKIQSVNLIAPRSTCEKCGLSGVLFMESSGRYNGGNIFAHNSGNGIQYLCNKCHLDAHRIGRNRYDADLARSVGFLAARSNGKSSFWTRVFEKRYLQITNPRVWHLAHYAKKSRTRKKNISRLEKIRRRIYE